ncbi:dihydrolipoamide acetyltransferase family protein [Solwaraspora sp. WMMD1047]|uniref:dihydrolipoamide acetyltransferase family protein n=1 Tax=Solwaraspora sp. WMMD1047 TaxID=3016102 RepID=UPI002417C10C|nr:dihydrolipoamide acetyltransferase family protein [Solwaraspora sp. WMMD1047]MDG4831372.1 dihydrolipoamide acetyltransferase family protein [Solwaraspora sp. WMMD1047]
MTATDTSQRTFVLPDLGEGLTEAEIVQWRVAVGDRIEVDQTVVEVETAKAVVDVPCPYAGRVVALHGRAGERRPVGQPLITIERKQGDQGQGEREQGDRGQGDRDGGPVERDQVDGYAAYREQERAGSGNVLIGYGTGPDRPGRRRRRVAPARQQSPTGPAAGHSPLVISPLVRKLARDHGLDLRGLSGSGPGGVIRRHDVTAALAGAPSTSAGGPSTPAGDDEVVVPLRGVRRAVAEKLARSRREIPEVTIWVDVDASALLATRAAINAARPDQPLGVLALLARICVYALGRFPELNSRVEPERDRIVQYRRVHLGIAAQTERGLVVPVIRDAQAMSARQLAASLAETTALARAGRLPPERLTGGTFTLNNYGVFGVDGSTPIINHPEAALLGLGRIAEKPWVVDGALAVRRVTQLSLTFDHRVCDGGVAGGFLRLVADCVERPELLIAEL